MPSSNGRNHSAPAVFTPTGLPSKDRPEADAQGGDFLTTAQGVRLPDTDHSLKAGERGPSLLEDFHLREKITHFDHERIPERVVHARGAAAHGIFESYGTASSVTKAGFLAEEGTVTPVFARFSTVLGSRGSADTVRDTRGFAVKFYTAEGTFDLVGNNIPVFFIQDGIKFPDIIHAAKPHPDVEIPQAQSAHDTFWDFVSLHTEATHHVLWNMSDRGIPRSFRTMEGFGVHTFRLVERPGRDVARQVPLEAGRRRPFPRVGRGPDRRRRGSRLPPPRPGRRHRSRRLLRIRAGCAGPARRWEDSFEGIDLLDPTKLVPEELAPVQLIGKMTLNRNPTNYFAETEQVAFHTGNLVPGIEATNDPLMQARLFSYLDTQLTRLGGPNFTQLPINRPHCPVNDMLRDGMHQTAVHDGISPYLPNGIDESPRVATAREGAYVHTPQAVEGDVVRGAPASFDDHYSQAALFYRSLTPIEQAHVVEAFTLRARQGLRRGDQEAHTGGAG